MLREPRASPPAAGATRALLRHPYLRLLCWGDKTLLLGSLDLLAPELASPPVPSPGP